MSWIPCRTMMPRILGQPTLAGKKEWMALALLNLEAEGAVLPALPPTILITESTTQSRVSSSSDHSHAFPVFEEFSPDATVAGRSAPESSAQAPSHPHPLQTASPKASRTTSNFQRAALGIWLQAFVHIDGGGEQLAFRGHLLGPIGHGTFNNSLQEQLQQPPPPSGPPPATGPTSGCEGPAASSLISFMDSGMSASPHLSVTPVISRTTVSTTGCTSACTPFHPVQLLSRKISIAISISSRNL